MDILLTGASGLLGRYAAGHLRGAGHRVTCVSRTKRLDAGSLLMDIGDPEQVKGLPGDLDCIVHLAARLPAPRVVVEPEQWFHDNAQATVNLLEHCARHRIADFVYGSTWSVYGNSADRLPIDEETLPAPAEFYSLSKLAGEILAGPFGFHHGIRVRTLRFSYLFGDGMRADTAIETFVRLAREGRPIPLIGGGGELTDILYAKDAAAAIGAAVSGKAGTYNIGSGVPRSIRQIAEAVVALSGSASTLFHGAEATVSSRRRYLSIEKAGRMLNWQPVYTPEAGLRDFIGSRVTHGQA